MKKPKKKSPIVVAKKPAPRDISTDYLDMVYDVEYFTKAVPKSVRVLKEFHKKHPFDAIAFTGCSGAAFAYPLSYRLKIPLICVRKGESSHYSHPLEGFTGAKRYLIVDDFISSGSTVRKIISTIKAHSTAKNPRAAGIFLYDRTCCRKKYLNIPLISI